LQKLQAARPRRAPWPQPRARNPQNPESPTALIGFCSQPPLLPRRRSTPPAHASGGSQCRSNGVQN
jgi:hypothetical protein